MSELKMPQVGQAVAKLWLIGSQENRNFGKSLAKKSLNKTWLYPLLP